jgi:CheY-like chemotaxis protein
VKTILLADDSITIQKVVELTFSEADYRVVSVSTGAQALKKVAEVRPDIVLLDVIMPEKNGYEVCEQLKRSPSTSGIPVLLLTGTFEPFDRKRAESAGADGHITKPFESQALVAKVEELISARPSVAADEEGGRMDIISGGEVYRVDPGRPEEGMRPASPAREAASPAPVPQAPSMHFGPASDSMPTVPPPASPVMPGGPERETVPHPALAPPDPAAGGSFVGFGTLGVGVAMDEGDIVPDRFDEGGIGAAGPTMRIRRDEVVPQHQGGGMGAAPHGAAVSSGSGSDESFAGSFESEFDLIDETPVETPSSAAADTDAGTGGWAPPPEAPPAETWQDVDASSGQGPQNAPLVTGTVPAAGSRTESAPAPSEAKGDDRSVSLTPEMIDLIAEKVVERLADRVVREVAWEVVPGVAEALVRRRIKEIEESGS